MNEPYAFRLTNAASQDIADIADYIAVELGAKDSALRLVDALEAAILRACRFPHAAAMVSDPLLAQKGYRKLIVENYIILYLCDDAHRILNIMRVVYFARDYFREL